MNFAIHDNLTCSCRNCKERYVGCHATCEKYLAFRNKLETIRKAENDAKDSSRIISWSYAHKEKKK